MSVDTSPRAVERLAKRLDGTPLYEGSGEESDLPEEAAATLRALAAERDRWQAQHDAAQAVAESRCATIARLEAEALSLLADRDAARAEVARLREAIDETLRRYPNAEGMGFLAAVTAPPVAPDAEDLAWAQKQRAALAQKEAGE